MIDGTPSAPFRAVTLSAANASKSALRAPGTPKVSRGLSGRPEGGRSIFRFIATVVSMSERMPPAAAASPDRKLL
jgi:hypothetical protein